VNNLLLDAGHLLATVLAECQPPEAEDCRRMWTRAAAGIFRDTTSAVANADVPLGTYTLQHLQRFRDATRQRAQASVVGRDNAASGRLAGFQEDPLPAAHEVPVPADPQEDWDLPGGGRHDLLRVTVCDLSETVSDGHPDPLGRDPGSQRGSPYAG
jgi:hypothetical protein